MFFAVAEAETPGTSANVPAVEIVEFEDSGVTFALPENFDEIEIVLSSAVTIPVNEEIVNTSPPAVAAIEEVVTVHGLAEPTATPSAISIVESLSPRPRIMKTRPRTRKTQSAAVITSSPFKYELQKMQESSARKSRKKSDNSTTKTHRRSNLSDQSKETCNLASISTKRKKSAKGRTKKLRKTDDERDDTPCCICSKKFNVEPFLDFMQCTKCCAWYCEPCGPAYTNECYNCLP
jgi:hypothetical protein